MLHPHTAFFLVLLLAMLPLGPARAAERTAWPAPDWDVAAPVSQGLSAEGVERVGAWLKDHGSKSGLLVRHGRIVGEWYFEDTDRSSRHLVYSTTKSFTSTAAGLAIADGKLSLDTRAGELLPDVKPEEKKQVTVRQMLSMTSGVHNEGALPSKPDQFSYAMFEAPMDFKPGEKWDYNNTGMTMLTPLIKAATGKSLDQLLDERLFRPIGITESDWTWDKNADQPLPYSGLHITARGLARFGLLVLNHGQWQGKQLVPAEWLAAAVGPSQDLNKTYGLLWWNNTTGMWPGVPTDAFAALGHLDNNMLLVPSLDLIVIRQVGRETSYKEKLDKAELFKLAVEAVQPAAQ